MDIIINTREGSRVAILKNEGEIAIAGVQDALDLMATVRSVHECDNLLIPKSAVCEEFFELRSGLAGEILQKFTTYGLRVALVGDFSVYSSKALRDFIRESNRGTQVFFLPTEQEALDALHRT